MQLLSIPGAIAALLALAVMAGGLYAGLRSGLEKKSKELWKERAEDLERRLTQVETEAKDCQQKYVSLSHEHKVLARQVTGETAIIALSAKVDTQHTEVMKKLNARRRS